MPLMKRVDNLIQNSHTLLESYFQTAKQLAGLSALLQEILPGMLKTHCQVANYKNGCLTIQAENAAWATQLRYLIPDLQLKLQALPQFKHLTTIRYFVAPAAAVPTAAHYSQPQLSAENAQLILDTAEHIPGALGRALRKIATYAKKR